MEAIEHKKKWAELGIPMGVQNSIKQTVCDMPVEDIIPIVTNVLAKSVTADIAPVKFNEIGDKIQEILEKVSKGKMTTNGGNGLTEELVGYENPTTNAENNG